MSFDLDQFHEAFFEESFEAIDGMEAALLKLDLGAPEPDLINTIFRTAHSIKGGSGMFGFNDIMSFTHTLETLLDELRGGNMDLKQSSIDLLLKSVDVLKGMLHAVQNKAAIDAQEVSDIQFELELVVAQGKKGSAAAAAAVPHAADKASALEPQVGAVPRWRIEFEPDAGFLAQGNDLLGIFTALEAFGTLVAELDATDLPDLEALDPERCFMRWQLELESDVSRDRIDEVFAWVADECLIRIESMPAAPDTAAEDSSLIEAVPTTKAAAASPVADDPVRTSSTPAGGDASSIRVSIEKIDELLNTVGEVVITQSMLSQMGEGLEGSVSERLRSGLSQLERHVRELQESVMRIRMLPISFVFSRFPRLVRDLSQQLGKKIDLKMTGEQTELDKTVLERVGDPLVHLVRNAVDHGIESTERRAASGKPKAGTVHLNAYHKGGAIIIEVSDDGAGLDRDRILAKAREKGLIDVDEAIAEDAIHDLMFLPGFSTAETTTDVSGRGVGMDVVKRNITELGGYIDVTSTPGQGSRFTINLPLTLAIVDGQSVAVGSETYIVPLVTIVESLQLGRGVSNRLVGQGEVFSFRGEYVPIVRLHELFDVAPRTRDLHEGLIMVVEGDGRKIGLFVDDLLGQQQVVIKSLETNYGRIGGISGATILGEGTVALILDVPGLIRLAADHLAAA
ncbi:MAG: chemotaxis protein CheA [Gammaproteobacteria bacterium]|nr:MAG: chemotaxis protein CheA [Gammaproteobacteria bacterium]